MKKQLAVLLAAIMLTACAEAPEEVQRENSILDNVQTVSQPEQSTADESSADSSESGENTGLMTLDEIRASLDSDIAENRSNVSARVVRVPESDAMPAVRLKKSFDDFGRIESIIKEQLGVDVSEHPERIKQFNENHTVFRMSETETLNFDTCKGSLMYTDPNDPGALFWSSNCGDLVASKGSDPYAGTLVKAYDKRLGDIFPDESYMMTDGKELTVSAAVKQAEDTADRYIAALYTDKTKVKVYRAEIYDTDAGHCITMLAEYADENGDLFFTNDTVFCSIEDYMKKTSPMIPAFNLMMWTDKAGALPSIVADSVPAAEEETASGDKLLSYGAALKRLQTRLASAAAYEFGCATLEYVVTAPYSEKYIEYRTDKDGDVSWQFYKELYIHIPETSYEARPYWVFRDFEKNPENNGESVWGGVYLVDALTGEIFVG